MLSVLMLSVIMVNVANNPFILGVVMLSVVMLNVIMLTVMAQILDLPENNFRGKRTSLFWRSVTDEEITTLIARVNVLIIFMVVIYELPNFLKCLYLAILSSLV